MEKITKAGMTVLTASLLAGNLVANASGTIPKAHEVFGDISYYSMESTAFLADAAAVTATQQEAFSDMPSTHWAYSSVMSAVKDGYVGGYPNGTFRPEVSVTRAEMIKMAVAATGIPVGKDTTKWYSSYVSGAENAGWIVKGDFSKGDYNTKMTRLEMIKLAVRASGMEAKTDNEYVLVAAQKGLVSGTSKGLELDGLTTRAQSVVIIQRILKLRTGGTLTVDQNAVKLAMDLSQQKTDPWGKAIRTENLPKNYTEFPYILKYFPNEGYEMGTGNYGTVTKKPIDVFYNGTVEKVQYHQLKQNVEGWFDLLLNVDYRTIKDDWGTDFLKLWDNGQMSSSSKQKLSEGFKDYAKWIKDNKLVTTGKAIAEISTLREYNKAEYYIRVYYEFSVDAGNKSAITNDGSNYNSIFLRQMPDDIALFKSDYKMGTKIKLVSEIRLDFNSNKGWGDLNYYKVAPSVNLTRNYIVVE